jgi:hypothetical protein
MKTFKITLSIIVVAVIAFLVVWWLIIMSKPKPISVPENPFTNYIKQRIDSLGALPDSRFSNETYVYLTYLIDDFYRPHPPQYPYGRLGNSQMENDQRKENFTRELYSAYAEKFIRQAFYVFRGSEWDANKLQFIRSEYQTLRRSNLLVKGSPVDLEFTTIQNVLGKYDEIDGFISTCKSVSFTDNSLSARFPVSDVQDKISQTNTYLNGGLGEYVNNCTSLRNELKEITQSLFKVHIRYLDNKIRDWSHMYMHYNTFNDYNNNLAQPIQGEINSLNKEMYNIPNFDSEKKRLQVRWDADKQAAYRFRYKSN